MTVLPGRRLGPYEVAGSLGAGGMGEVYLAVDSRLGRQVAVKIMPARLAVDVEMRERFTREARAVAALSHPNIVTIHDVGMADGIAYAVMEFVEGETLRTRLGGGPLSAATALDYARQIGCALAAAHGKGIVHRDLKPENVKITPGGLVKVLDFGLAKVDPPGGSDHATQMLTEPGTLLGTVGYMSPEQVRGSATDHRTDIFALGAMLFEMLTGVPAFVRDSPPDTITAVLRDDLPTVRAGTFARDPLAESVSEIAARCVRKDPEQRYQSAAELVQAIDGARGGTSLSSAARRAQPADPRPTIAVLPFADQTAARDQGYLCEGMAEEIVNALTKVRGLKVVSRMSAQRFRDQHHDVRQVGAILGAATVLEGSVRRAANRLRVSVQLTDSTDGCLVWSERFDRDLEDVFAVQDEIARCVAEALEVRLGGEVRVSTPPPRPADFEAYSLYLKGRFHWNRRTETQLTRSVEYFRRALERDPSYAHAHAGLADAYVTLGVYGVQPPEDVMPQARAAAEQALAIAPRLADAHVSLACVLALYDWRWADAERHFRDALEIAPEFAQAHQWYGINLLTPLRRFDAAIDALGRALSLEPLSLTVHASLGAALVAAGRPEEGRDILTKALEMDPGFAIAHLFLGRALAAIGQPEDALTNVERAVRLSGNSPEMLAAHAGALARTGDRGGVERLSAQIAALSTERYVSPCLLAQVALARGERDAAIDLLERAGDRHAPDLVWARVHAEYDPLRGDPRFERVLARMGPDRV